MSLRKKVILGVVIAIIVFGTVGGIVAANTDTGTTTTETVATNPQDTLLEKIASKLGVSVDELTTAIQEARSEIQQERLDAWLGGLVADGKITQDQADAFKEWLNSRPSDEEFLQALQDWREANPLADSDIQLPRMGNFGGFKAPGMGGRIGPMGGFGCR